MKNKVIRNRFAALSLLSDRVLPTEIAVNKVSVLLRTRFHDAYEATEIGRKSILRDHPLPEGWDKEQLPAAIAEARQMAVDRLMERGQPIKKIPDTLRLTSADMPRVLKTKEDGERNVAGLAGIKVALGGLYKWSDEELGLDEQTNELEIDGQEEEALELVGAGAAEE